MSFFGKIRDFFIPSHNNKYRPKILEGGFLFYCFAAFLFLKLVLVIFLFSFPSTDFFADISKTTLIDLTNKERQSAGLAPLKENDNLNQAAFLKAKDMLSQGYFSHQSPDGNSPWYWFLQVGYNYQRAGENLGIGFLDSEELHNAWNKSPSHKDNLLNPGFQDIGIAVVQGNFNGNPVKIVVQLFGRQAPYIQQNTISLVNKEPASTGEEAAPITASGNSTSVLSAANEEPLAVSASSVPQKGLVLTFWQFMDRAYNNLVQTLTFLFLIFIVIILLLNIFVKFEVQHRDLLFKTMFFICLLIILSFLGKKEVLSLLPHSLRI